MVDVIQSWLGSGEYAILNDTVVKPCRLDEMSSVPLMARGKQGSVYYLIDDQGERWILKKFFAETQPDSAYLETIQALVPRRPGFESGIRRQILRSSSVSGLGYSEVEFLAWVDGTILMPQVMSLTWSEVAASIREGSAVLSRVERLLLCQKLSEMVGWLESAGLAHRDLSSTNVMMDPLNVEVHLIDWDSLYHPSLDMPVNTTLGTDGYIAPFVTTGRIEDPGATWQQNSDRFGLTVLNVELLLTSAGASLSGSLPLQDDSPNPPGRSLDEARESLRRSFPAAVEFLNVTLAARSFAECPSPSEWIELSERELSTSEQTTWDEANAPTVEVASLYAADYEPHFVAVNTSAFVRINHAAFVRAPAARRHT